MSRSIWQLVIWRKNLFESDEYWLKISAGADGGPPSQAEVEEVVQPVNLVDRK